MHYSERLNKNIALTETVIYGPFTDYSLQQVVRYPENRRIQASSPKSEFAL